MNFTNTQLLNMAGTVRADALRAILSAHSGHVGIVLEASLVITAIYANYLRLSDWENRDRFVLSAGHGSAMLYSVLKLRGFDLPSLDTFRKLDGLPGHPEYGINGTETSTGPLGQGIANAVGMALGLKIGGRSGRVYCLCSDGDLMEGVSFEAMSLVGRYKLDNLVLIWLDNGISIDGTALVDLDPALRMKSAGFEVMKINGDKPAEINAALEKVKSAKKPVFIQCKTVLGVGSSVAGTAVAHGFGLGEAELEQLIKRYENKTGRELWSELKRKAPIGQPGTPPVRDKSECPHFFWEGSVASTRELSGKYLETLIPENPLLVGGSADLAGNTFTRVKGSVEIKAGFFSGNFVNYGVREHAMAAIMNGLALVGLRPYGGTFLVFSDYMRPAMRLSALMGLPVIYVLSHDSVAVGEDGPTHQPVEQLASLRLIPNMNVFRPCNVAEIEYSWDNALAETRRPSCIVLSRQKFEQVQGVKPEQGGYVIYDNPKAKITFVATGSEVSLAVNIAKRIGARVVSIPWLEKFRKQSDAYKRKLLRGKVIALEAGSTASWYEFADAVVGIDTFGETGPGEEVYKKLGFNPEDIIKEIKNEKI